MAKREVPQLEALLDRYVCLLEDMVSGLERELRGALGGKPRTVTPDDLRRLKDLSAAFNSATDAKIRIDKAEKGKKLTPEQLLEGAVKLIAKRSYVDRRRAIGALLKSHNEQAKANNESTDAFREVEFR